MPDSNETLGGGESALPVMLEEWRYLRREVLLRESIQNIILIVAGIGFGLTTGLSMREDGGDWWLVGYVAGCTALAGFCGYNDNIQLKMRPRLIEIEDLIGIGWERWVTSSRVRLVGPIGSGYQLTTRGFFLGSQLVAVGWASVLGGLDLLHLVSMAGCILISVLLLRPPRLREQ